MAKTAETPLAQPLVFEPIFMERVWGGRHLESLYGKHLPRNAQIGESWEIVDRPEAQSVVRGGAWRGRTLHDLWLNHRADLFGNVPASERFPILIKLLDAAEKLSLQVHPPADVAEQLGGEPKCELWYVTDAADDAELYVGMKNDTSRRELERALDRGTVEEHLHRIRVRAGDAMFLPSGRMHAIGAGLVIVEIQENSDTTYRVFDWNRRDAAGKERELHVEASLQSIDFDDFEPELVRPDGESLVRHESFAVERWDLPEGRSVAEPGEFAIVGCLTGAVRCAGIVIKPGEFLFASASLKDRELRPNEAKTSLLRVTLPS